jgi:NAD(P)-dependent dehydrogenase (short-subunit alcohol dehydrogenase family)
MAGMEGKICMVTGANAGIGKETALALARMGAEVVMVCRNQERGEAARSEISRLSDNERVRLMQADFSSQQSIRDLAAAFRKQYDRLDVLVNNAGAIYTERSLTVDGLECTFATNHLGYFLLTNLLLDVLKASAPARIVNVASEAHKRGGGLRFDDLQCEAEAYSGFPVYGRSKLANILFTFELARRLEGTGVTANCLHPGVVASNFGTNTPGFFKLLVRMVQPFMISSEKGAETSVFLASSPEVEGVSGKYFARKRAVRARKRAYNEADQRRLWEISAELTGLALKG